MNIKINTDFPRFLLIILLGFLLTYCAPEPITVNNITGFAEIREGESTRLEWDFKNADHVSVEGIAGTFKAKDFFLVNPNETTKYKLIAYQGNDSLIQYIRVNVNKEIIQRGPNIYNQKFPSQSIVESEYFSGIMSKEQSSFPKKIKIIRSSCPDNKNQYYRFRFLLLDEFGNFITGLKNPDDSLNLKVVLTSGSASSSVKFSDIIESTPADKKNLDLMILADNSDASLINNTILTGIKDNLAYLSPDDNFAFSIFNQNYTPVISFSATDKAIWEFNSVTIPDNKGMCGIYKASSKALSEFAGSNSANRALVLITSYTDNSSLIFNSEDMEKLALQYNVPVYIIGAGTAVSSYQLKYLCERTGGKYYRMNCDDTTDLGNIIREIILSQKYYYEVTAPEFMVNENDNFHADFKFRKNNTEISNDLSIIKISKPQFTHEQCLATFNYRDTSLSDDYEGQFNSLSTVMKDNKDTRIELLGNSSDEDAGDFNDNVSVARAQAAKNKLCSLGIQPDRISIKGNGFRKPLFQFEQFPWQGTYNRRVSVRWLSPSLLPFEIIASSEINEETADSKSALWEKRGFRAYYERILESKDSSIYRVKLWGFPTADSAETTAKMLTNKYNYNFIVE